MKLSKNLKKFLFFWIIFHTIAYSCYLFEIQPKSESETVVKNDVLGINLITKHTHYYLVPPSSPYDYLLSTLPNEKENFYPFHKFVNESWGNGYEYCEFVGVFGYYGNYEYLVYVILPLLTLGMVWVYRKFIA